MITLTIVMGLLIFVIGLISAYDRGYVRGFNEGYEDGEYEATQEWDLPARELPDADARWAPVYPPATKGGQSFDPRDDYEDGNREIGMADAIRRHERREA